MVDSPKLGMETRLIHINDKSMKIKNNQLQCDALNADPIAWWLGRQTVPLTSSGNLNNDLMLSASVYSSVK